MDISLNQLTYDKLRKDILTFSLKPGEPISAQRIAERYEVSRTPAREALVRLQDEGMVDIYPQSCSVVALINIDRIRQEWYVRKTLELGMVDAFFDKVTEKDIDLMRKSIRELSRFGSEARTHENSYEYLSCDDQFHEISYAVAGEKLAATIIRNSLMNYKRARLLVDFDSVNKDRTVEDHETLLRYVEKGDREAYRSFLGVHLSRIIGDMNEMKEQFPDMFDKTA